MYILFYLNVNERKYAHFDRLEKRCKLATATAETQTSLSCHVKNKNLLHRRSGKKKSTYQSLFFNQLTFLLSKCLQEIKSKVILQYIPS